MGVRSFLLKAHLSLALSAGLIMLALALTGAVAALQSAFPADHPLLLRIPTGPHFSVEATMSSGQRAGLMWWKPRLKRQPNRQQEPSSWV